MRDAIVIKRFQERPSLASTLSGPRSGGISWNGMERRISRLMRYYLCAPDMKHLNGVRYAVGCVGIHEEE